MSNDIKTMSLVELKAVAYDHLANIEQSKNVLNIVNNEITLRMQPAEQVQGPEVKTSKGK